jgi:TetR/AcrR family transcriptional repressor of nem operon
MCLCGMLAAEYATLPKPMRSAVTLFFDDNESWLERVLVEGQKDGSVRLEGTPRDGARMIVSGLEGAMLIARSYGDSQRFQVTAQRLLEAMTGHAKSRKPRSAKRSASARSRPRAPKAESFGKDR